MYLINSMLQGFHWRPREARKIFFPTFDEQLGCWFLVFIFSLFYSDSSQTGGTLTQDMRSGALLLPSWFLFAPVLRFKPLISYRTKKIFSISDLQQFCALGGFLGHFSPGQCPATESAKISGDDLSLFWSHHVQYYSFKVVLLSCATDLIFNLFFFFFLMNVGQCSQCCLDLCREKALEGPPRLKHLLHPCSQRSRFCYPGDVFQSDIPEIAEPEVRA